MKFNWSLNLKNRICGFNIELFNVKKGQTIVKGTGNRCYDNKFVFYNDYDHTELDFVEAEIKHLQEVGIIIPGQNAPLKLGTTHIFKSSESKEGYHVVGFEKYTALEFVQFLLNSSGDRSFLDVPRYTTLKNFVLRAFEKGDTPKPVYVKTLVAESDKEQSSPHWKFFSISYPEINNYPLTKPDNKNEIYMIKYLTANNVGKV